MTLDHNNRNAGTPIPLDTHPAEHSSPWNTHPPGTLIPPGTPTPLEHPSPQGTLIPHLIFFPCARCTTTMNSFSYGKVQSEPMINSTDLLK